MEKSADKSCFKKIGDFSYDTSSVLGEGAFSKVYLGWRIGSQDVRLAIKKLDRKFLQSHQYLKNGFSNQLNILRKLDSPNIIKFIKFYQTEENYYIIQQLSDGGDLSQRMKDGLSQPQALALLRDLLNGWRSLIKLGVVHRDLKPENILIKGDSYKIGDFGFAKCVQNHMSRMHKTLLGTPQYMSPQILNSEQYSSKCDIWSMGVILFRAIFKASPYDFKILKRIDYTKNHDIKFPHQLATPHLKNFIQNCLKFKQCQRMSWKQVYQHPLTKDMFPDPFQENIQMELQSIFKRKINDLMLRTIDQLFSGQQLTKNLISKNEFEQALLRKGFENSLIKAIIKKFQKTGKLNIKEIKNWLNQDQILIQKPVKNQVQISNACKAIVHKIKQTDMLDLFKQFDKQDNDYLEFSQFKSLLQSLGEFKEETKEQVFKRFDVMRSGNVSFSTFRSVVQSYK